MATKSTYFQSSNATEERWYYLEPGEVQPAGPIALNELRQRLEQKKIHKKAIVWRKGMNQWEPVENIPQLKAKSFFNLAIFGFGRKSDTTVRASIDPKES